ncbi:LVIVD repeat-containing protein [Pseudalkalibacillus sp. Hm43]|uniref:LVIVD repeat-containing protein n=1 Tax=Pseudalkalibacillus sp. Hm43 TaxID=3450742 RepID=UPI003F437447
MKRAITLFAAVMLILGSGISSVDATHVNLEGEANVPVISSDNVQLVNNMPHLSIISAAFSKMEPYMYANTLSGIAVYDITDPTKPMLKGELPEAHFENEDMTFGERENGTKFVLIGYDPAGVTPTYDDKSISTGTEVAVVDVSDPENPYVASRVKTTTRTHTVTCANDECTYAYTSGSEDENGNPAFSIINLEDPANAFEEKVFPSSVDAVGHDWDIDSTGIAWHTGLAGTVAYDISDPLNPVVLNSTDERGLNGTSWNNFIHHNTLRPNGDQFENRAPAEMETGESTERTADQIRAGEVVMVTEEDYLHPGTCDDEGSFQTWHLQNLDEFEGQTNVEPGSGTIEPLDTWNSKILGTDTNTKAGFICSAHYSSYHEEGFVSIGYYQQGVRILDVRDPSDIKQIGYWFTGIQETWGAQWVPDRDEEGKANGEHTNYVYAYDPTRGLDILKVTFPDESPANTLDLKADISIDMIEVPATDLSDALQDKMSHNHDH